MTFHCSSLTGGGIVHSQPQTNAETVDRPVRALAASDSPREPTGAFCGRSVSFLRACGRQVVPLNEMDHVIIDDAGSAACRRAVIVCTPLGALIGGIVLRVGAMAAGFGIMGAGLCLPVVASQCAREAAYRTIANGRQENGAHETDHVPRRHNIIRE